MSPPILCTASQPIWAAQVQVSHYRRDGDPGVLHLGLGAFHRAHQAMVFDRLLASGDTRWGVHAVGMRQPGLVDALNRQDGLYLVRVADGQSVQWVVPSALWRLSLAATERDRVIQAMSHPALRWITLTVTEKGYTPELGQLIAEGLALRSARNAPGLTIASCDNLRGNGRQLGKLVLNGCTTAHARSWIEAHCAFPNSMVDRIVPASTETLRDTVAGDIGVSDASPLGTERFWEWVIEDHFADPSDAEVLRSAGVKVTSEVHVYEDAKLRMLNGSHSAMAIFGAITGRAVISDCIGHEPIRRFVTRLMEREVAPHLQRSDWADYRDALIKRFGNPYLRHSVHQIAMDSSQKIPQRWPPSVLAQLAAGRGIEHHALAAAAWLRYGLAVNERGEPYEISDPQAALLKAIAASQRAEPNACVERFLAQPELWGDSLKEQGLWVERVKAWHARILADGMDASIDRLLQEVP
jgi:fructuronate reductase